MTEQEIRDLFKSKGVQLAQSDVWSVQKALVIKHAALERLAAKIGVKFAPPTILRAETDESVILVSGSLGEESEWSIGEAKVVPMVDTGQKNSYGKPIYEPAEGALGNYQITPKQAAYPYAMAEKRAKDRVILKLAKLHGAYSEDEADDFKNAPAEPSKPGRSDSDAFGLPPVETDESKTRYLEQCKNRIAQPAATEAELRNWWKAEAGARRAFDLTQDEVNSLMKLLTARLETFKVAA